MAFGFKQWMHIVINMCAVTSEKRENLIEAVSEVTKISDENEMEMIKTYIEESKPAKVLSRYIKSNPQAIKNPEMIKTLMRENWFACFLIQNINELDRIDIKQILKDKAKSEKDYSSNTDDRLFGQFSILVNKDERKKDLIEFATKLMPYKDSLWKSLEECTKYFDEMGISYMGDLYAKDIVGEMNRTIKEARQVKTPSQTIVVNNNDNNNNGEKRKTIVNHQMVNNKVNKTKNKEKPKDDEDEPIISVEFLAEVEEKLKSFKAQITYLENTNHEKDVLLAHAEKDALRTVMLRFCDLSYGCPLGELYRYWKNEEPSNPVKQMVSNLFFSLADANIHTYKEQLVNTSIQITKENANWFKIESGDELKQGDEVIVKYPGFRIGQEVLVKPFAYKKGEKDNG